MCGEGLSALLPKKPPCSYTDEKALPAIWEPITGSGQVKMVAICQGVRPAATGWGALLMTWIDPAGACPVSLWTGSALCYEELTWTVKSMATSTFRVLVSLAQREAVTQNGRGEDSASRAPAPSAPLSRVLSRQLFRLNLQAQVHPLLPITFLGLGVLESQGRCMVTCSALSPHLCKSLQRDLP